MNKLNIELYLQSDQLSWCILIQCHCLHSITMSKIDSILQIWIEASMVAVSFAADAHRKWRKWRLGWVQSVAACSQLQSSAAKIYWNPISAISFLGHFFSGALWVTTSLGCFLFEANAAPTSFFQSFHCQIRRDPHHIQNCPARSFPRTPATYLKVWY